MDSSITTQMINSFEEVLRRYGFIKREFTQAQIEMIRKKIEEHDACHEEWVNDEDVSGEPMIEVAVYGGGENVALECTNCNSVIIDSEYFTN